MSLDQLLGSSAWVCSTRLSQWSSCKVSAEGYYRVLILQDAFFGLFVNRLVRNFITKLTEV